MKQCPQRHLVKHFRLFGIQLDMVGDCQDEGLWVMDKTNGDRMSTCECQHFKARRLATAEELKELIHED